MKKLVSLGIAFVVLFSMSGCAADIDGKYNGFSSGFNYMVSLGYTHVECAARSEKFDFNFDDVTLDFYFGWLNDSPENYTNDIDTSLIVFYFHPTQVDSIMRYSDETDYRNIKGLYYMADIPAQDFASDKYAISMTKKAGKTFNESKEFTVPEDIFLERKNSFLFMIFHVTFYSENDTYTSHALALMEIKCEYINDTTVRLRKSFHL